MTMTSNAIMQMWRVGAGAGSQWLLCRAPITLRAE
jgi:hypothetical protein